MAAHWLLTCQSCYWQESPVDLVDNPLWWEGAEEHWLCPRCHGSGDAIRWQIEKNGVIVGG